VRIDRSDLADEPDDVHLARCARSAPDDSDAPGKDQAHASESDGPSDSSPARPDSGLRLERAAAYRAAVDAAHRQDATDHDYARAYDVQTGARGPASGREFDPEAAGGPIQPLEAGEARITSAGVQEVTAHLQRFTGAGALAAPEQAMLDRLTSIAAGDTEPASYDLNFYTHELEEAPRATGTGTPGG